MTERRSSREEGRANETNKRRGTLRQGRSWTRRYIPPRPPFTRHGNPPTHRQTQRPTVLSQGQPPTSAVTCVFCLFPGQDIPKEPLDETSRRWTPTVRPSSPSPVPARLRPILKRRAKKKKVTGQPVSNSAPAKCFQSACFMAAGQCHEPTVFPFSVVAGDRRIELDRGGAWVGNETDQVFEGRPVQDPLIAVPLACAGLLSRTGQGGLSVSEWQPTRTLDVDIFFSDRHVQVQPDGET